MQPPRDVRSQPAAQARVLGGAIAAFAVSAALLALLLCLAIYLQNVLGYSALGTGVRLLAFRGEPGLRRPLGAARGPRFGARPGLGAGLALVGVGLMLMRGIDAGSDWTALVAGLVTSGVGVGLVNPALASAAVDVVEPRRAGMGSGTNSAFRQLGIATESPRSARSSRRR